jgi:branched-chain amino acid transport system ATP-binding protein
MTSPILEATGLAIAYGGIRAVDGMDIQVFPGSITGLIGPNGAGKSTLFNLLSGVTKPQSGRVAHRGEDITTLPPWRRARRGMIRTFQLSREFAGMTVLENLMMAPQGQLGERLLPLFLQPRRVREEDAKHYARALEVLEISNLGQVRDRQAGDLSGGQKKLLELARTLMIDCDTILLDEPGAGVNPALMKTLSDMIAVLNRDHGKTFLIVEHDMDLIRKLCDPVVVMSEGKPLMRGTFDQIRADARVMRAYLGGAHL